MSLRPADGPPKTPVARAVTSLRDGAGDLTQFFRARLSQRQDAEDRADEVLPAFLEMTDSAEVRGPQRAYLYSAARHLLYQQWTEQRRWREFTQDREQLTRVTSLRT